MKKLSLLLIVVLCLNWHAALAEVISLSTAPHSSADDPPTNSFFGKTILWVSSYHRGYEANDDIERGIISTLQNSGVSLHVFFMDTKRNNSPQFGKQAALRILHKIEELKPDVLIASDDNAQRYLVEPYLKDGTIPVIFCGVNWDASQYGYPAANITGMVEVDLTLEMFQLMKQYAAGGRIGYLSGNVEIERNLVDIYNRKFFNNTMRSYLVNSMAEFKKSFILAQQENDILYFYNYTGIKDWDPIEAELFISRHIRKPLGSHNSFMSPFVVFVVGKSLEEHGRYAAETALRILNGEPAGKIPLTQNSQAELYVNLRLAKAASLVLPVSLLKTATVIRRMEANLDPPPEFFQEGRYRGKRVLWVNSYHKGYTWSDAIGRGIRNIFYESGIEFDVFYMNTLENHGKAYNRNAGLLAFQKIRAYNPDLVIASDDNAQEFLVKPYLLKREIPVIFCGVNHVPERYGYPTPSITGMLEVQPVMELQHYLQLYAKGNRVGFLSGDVPMQRQLAQQYNEQFFDGRLQTYFVKTMEEFKQDFLAAQQDVDMLIFSSYFGIKDWNKEEAVQFIAHNNTLPLGAYAEYMQPYVIFNAGKLPEEQGYFAAKTALSILDGTKPEDIPFATNHLSQLIINIELANAAKFILPYRLLRSASVVGKQNKNLLKE